MPKARTVASEAPSAQASTFQSRASTTCWPLSPVDRTARYAAAQCATKMAQIPPASASSSDSRIKGRSSRRRDAPRAERTANSRARDIVRASRKFARFEQAISSTKPDKPTSIVPMVGPFESVTDRVRVAARHELAPLTSGKSLARRAPKLTMKPSASTRVMLAGRRPISRSVAVRRSADCAWSRASGLKRSTQPRWRQSLNAAGNTPTISCGSPSTRTTRPMTSARPPKRFCQKRWLMMMTRSLPWTSSAGRKSRPSCGCVPSTEKKLPVTRSAAAISAGWPGSERLVSLAAYAAISA